MKAGEIVSRQNFFVQTNDVLFQQEPFPSSLDKVLSIGDIRIRHERQTLTRMPKTGAILFTVRTYLTPLVDLQDEPDSVAEFMGAVRALPDDMAKYKGRPLWGEVAESWCDEVLARRDVSSL
jgi:hypothetical protein